MTVEIKHLLISEMNDGEIIIPDSDCYFFIKKSLLKTGKNNQKFLNIDLTDGFSVVNGKVWNAYPEIEKIMETGNIIQVLDGRISKYQGSLQIIIEKAKLVDVEKIEECCPGILPESKKSKQELLTKWNELKADLSEIYKSLIDEFEKNEKIWDLFQKIPAGKSMHHAYRRGLLEHSVDVALLAKSIAKKYKERYEINIDLIVTSAMLHDVGKIFEFKTQPPYSVVERYTDRGRLLGHIYMGTTFIEKLLKKVVGNVDLQMSFLHILLSHHGEYEFGSPKKPKTMEALIVSTADNLDANLQSIQNGFDAEMNENWTKTIYSLQRPFYKMDV